MISDKEFLQLKDNKCIVCRQSNISENTKTCVYFVNARKSLSLKNGVYCVFAITEN